MAFVLSGLLNKPIASEMDLSEITVKVHRGQAMRKMNARSLPDLVRKAESLGITPQLSSSVRRKSRADIPPTDCRVQPRASESELRPDTASEAAPARRYWPPLSAATALGTRL